MSAILAQLTFPHFPSRKLVSRRRHQHSAEARVNLQRRHNARHKNFEQHYNRCHSVITGWSRPGTVVHARLSAQLAWNGTSGLYVGAALPS